MTIIVPEEKSPFKGTKRETTFLQKRDQKGTKNFKIFIKKGPQSNLLRYAEVQNISRLSSTFFSCHLKLRKGKMMKLLCIYDASTECTENTYFFENHIFKKGTKGLK